MEQITPRFLFESAPDYGSQYTKKNHILHYPAIRKKSKSEEDIGQPVCTLTIRVHRLSGENHGSSDLNIFLLADNQIASVSDLQEIEFGLAIKEGYMAIDEPTLTLVLGGSD